MSKLGDKLYHKRLPEFEAFDAITLRVVPRYKESELSGDEWRQSVRVEFHHKGVCVHETAFGDMKSALLMLGAEYLNQCSPIHGDIVRMKETYCDQPSCQNKATTWYKLKQEYELHSGTPLPNSNGYEYYRKFCDRHKRRGDCGLEDSDENYIQINRPGA